MHGQERSEVKSNVLISLVVAMGLHGCVFLFSPHLLEAPATRPSRVELEFAPLTFVAEPEYSRAPIPVEPPRLTRRSAPSARTKATLRKTDETSAPAAEPEASPEPSTPTTQGVASGAAASGPSVSGTGTSNGNAVGHPALGVAHASGAGRGQGVQLASRRWDCAWPAEAEHEDILEQLVPIRVVVTESGVVERVDVLSDPGYGFGAAARRCARSARFSAARDASGRLIRAQSAPIHVRFVRQ